MTLRLADVIKTSLEDAFTRSRQAFYESYKPYEIGEERTFRLNTDRLWGAEQTYEQAFEKNKSHDKLPKKGDLDDILQTVYETMNYIQMSPLKIYEHNKTYIISRMKEYIPDIESFLSNSSEVLLNSSYARVMQVFDFWVKKAKMLIRYDDSTPAEKARILELSKFLILGKPGVGKTALLNYVFSLRAPDMLNKENNVIWVRVDLNDQRDVNLNLKERLITKFIRIFAANYTHDNVQPFNDNFYRQLRYFLRNRLLEKEKNSSDDIEFRTHDAVESFFSMVNAIYEDEHQGKYVAVPKLCSFYQNLDMTRLSDLVEWTMEFIQRKYTYAFIIIFDGLDSVTLDRIQFKLYQGWLQDIDAQTANERNKYKAVYIITMRDYTYIDFYLKIMKDRRAVDNEYVPCKVEQVSFYSILSGRFALILEKLEASGINSNKVQLWYLKNNILDAVNMCLYGLPAKEFSEKYVAEKAMKRESYDMIPVICNGNYRGMLRCLREMLVVFAKILKPNPSGILMSGTGYDNFLKYLDGKEWTIYRVLVSGNHGERTYRNIVLYDSDGTARIQSRNIALIPNLFNYKDTGVHAQEEKFPRNLLKIRAIQYAKKQRNISNLSLIDKLGLFYNSNRQLIRDDLREMIYCGLFIPLVEDTEFIKREEEGAHYPIKCTELAENMIDRILKESVYYEIVCDDTPIDSRYIDKIIPLNRYDSSVTTLGEYLLKKTRSMINFLFYLEKIELAEKKRYEKVEGGGSYESHGFPIFTPTLFSQIKVSIGGYLYTYLRKKRNRVELLKNWYRYFDIPEPEWLRTLKDHDLL